MAVFLSGLLVTLYLAKHERVESERETEKEFESDCKETQAKIEQRLGAHEQVLRSAAALFAASKKVSRSEWHNYVGRQGIHQNLLGVQGLGFALVVPSRDLATHLQAIRAEGFPSYRIWPEGERALYTTIVYLEPFSGRNLRAFGYDMFSETVRRSAMEKARDLDAAILSGKVKLVQETQEDVQAGTLIYVPVYRNGQPATTIDERRAALLGWVYSPFRMKDLIEAGILGNWDLAEQRHIRLEIFDGTTPTADSLLYDSLNGPSTASSLEPKRARQTIVPLLGQHWLMRFTKEAGIIPTARTSTAWWMVGTGTTISCLLAGLLLALFNTRRNALQLAERLTLHLRQSEAQYRSLIESSPEAVAVHRQGNVIYLNNAAVRLMGAKSATELIGASIFAFIHPDFHAPVTARAARLTTAGDYAEPIEVTLLKVDGSPFTAESQSSVVTYDGALAVRVVMRDVSLRKQAAVALQRSEELYRSILHASPDDITITDLEGRITMVSPAAYTIFGYSEEVEFRNRSILDFLVPEDRERAQFHLGHSSSGASIPTRSYRALRRDGSTFDIEVNREFIRNEAGQPTGIILVVRDITERKAHEREIERLNRLYQVLTEVNRAIALAKTKAELFEQVCQVLTGTGRFHLAWIGWHNPDSRTLTAVAIANDTNGYVDGLNVSSDPSLPTGRGPSGISLRENRPYICNDFASDPSTLPWRERAIRNGIRSSIALPLREQGQPVAILTVYSQEPQFFQSREVSLLEETAHDLSFALNVLAESEKRQLAEATLRLHSAALKAAANAIIITDRQGTIHWANPAFSALSGWSLDEVLGKNPRALVKSGHHDAEFYHQMWDTITAGNIWRGELVNRRKNGDLRTEDMTITPLSNEQGEITHFIAIKQDITDQKIMEAHILRAQRTEAIGSLAGGVAHDLNNILSPILMVTGMLKEKVSEKDDSELLTMAMTSAQRGAEIVKQLLTFSRGQSGEHILVQTRHLLSEILSMMRETFPRNIEIKREWTSELWPVLADATQLHQVFLNLCVNARDAMPNGGVLTIGADNMTLNADDPKLPPSTPPGPYLAIEIKDTGHGIPPEIRHRIFDPFFTTKPLGKGTGLGLSTAAGIIKHHGGFVDLESAPDKGTRFRVYLPAKPNDIAPSVPLARSSSKPSDGQKTILVVDDEPNIRETLRLFLEAQNYRVLTAENGELGLALFIEHRVDLSLIVTDLMMPTMNGLTMIRSIRVLAPTLPIIATSGLSEIAEQRELLGLGVHMILTKPYDAATLLEILRSQLHAS